MTTSYPIIELVGSKASSYIDAIAALRIEIFREYPYLYDGNTDYERHYLQGLQADPNAQILIAKDGEAVIAAATALPLDGPADITQAADIDALCQKAELDLATTFYYSEILVRKAYRNQGLAAQFYEKRRHFARSRGFRHACFAGIIGNPKTQPNDYFDPSSLWQKLGFEPQPSLTFTYTWPTLQEDGSSCDQSHTMMFWTAELKA